MRRYHSLLYLVNNKFLGESYIGRCYGESDDEEEELYCTVFLNIYALKRSHYAKLNYENKIVYYVDKIVCINTPILNAYEIIFVSIYLKINIKIFFNSIT